ncbi:hypothetical protein DXA09_22120 [Absiella sp. AM54-8XD]|uniref:RHS repeat-associated core domain-containing protein n=1 Tax=Absiella sp. AM54-8XD TaxID=2292279 RepID=UPI000E41358A|nr:hypothetical protein DXA09_22120 [Absiella sp. AM54-8XD]
MIKKVENTDKVTTYTYDILGRMIKQTQNGKVISTNQYDALGNVLEKMENGLRVHYSYDAMNRVLEESYPNDKGEYSTIYTHTYDETGNLIKTTDAYGKSKKMTYTPYGEVTSETDENDHTTRYDYDGVGNIKKVQNALDRIVRYEYDGNGKKNSYTYDAMDELTKSIKYIKGKEVTTTYAYDLNGNKVEISSNGKFKRYHYNKYNQLTSIFTEEGSTDIYYDKNGNMRDVLYAGGGKEHYDYDEYGQLSKVTNDKDKSYTYSYDAQGDRIRYQKNYSEAYDNDTWYESLEQTSFEEVEELLDDKNSDQIIESVRYQSNYRKTHHKCVLMEEENWDSDGDDWENKNIAYILDKSLENAEVLATSTGEINIYGQDERLSTDSKTSDGINKTVNYVNGNNNSVYGMATTENAWGDIRYKYKAIEYTDYGYSDDIKSGFGYNGEEQDETGLIYLRARYYNPVIGQFIQLDENRGDAGNIESQNRYAYALNNPNKYIDKNGRAARLMNDGGSFSSIGGLIGAAGKLAKDIATKSVKKNQSTSQMTSQDRYNLWMGHDSWDNYGGKPKGVYATQADYNKAHQKPSTSYKVPQTQDQRNPKAKTANTTRETYVPNPACSAIETLGKNLNDFKEEVLKGLNTVGKYIAKGAKAVGEFLESILDVVAAAGALIVFAGGLVVAGFALAAIITALTGSVGIAAAIGAFAAKGGMYVMYAGAIDMVLSGTQVLSGTLGCRLSGEKLTKEQAEQRINNGQTNLTLSYAGATFGYGASFTPNIVNDYFKDNIDKNYRFELDIQLFAKNQI